MAFAWMSKTFKDILYIYTLCICIWGHRMPTFYRSPALSLAKQTQSLYSLIEAVLLFCMQEWFRACRPVPLSILVALTSGKEHFLLLPLCSPLHALKSRWEDVRAVLTYTRSSDKNQNSDQLQACSDQARFFVKIHSLMFLVSLGAEDNQRN